MQEPFGPTLCWSRTGPSHRSTVAVSKDHGTFDRKTTLCGIVVGGFEAALEWDPHKSFSCQRCKRAYVNILNARGAGTTTGRFSSFPNLSDAPRSEPPCPCVPRQPIAGQEDPYR